MPKFQKQLNSSSLTAEKLKNKQKIINFYSDYSIFCFRFICFLIIIIIFIYFTTYSSFLNDQTHTLFPIMGEVGGKIKKSVLLDQRPINQRRNTKCHRARATIKHRISLVERNYANNKRQNTLAQKTDRKKQNRLTSPGLE